MLFVNKNNTDAQQRTPPVTIEIELEVHWKKPDIELHMLHLLKIPFDTVAHM